MKQLKQMKQLSVLFIMFVLAVSVTIGNYKFARASQIEVERSARQVGTTAKITLPTEVYVGENLEKVADIVKIGDKVSVELAYDGVYRGNEFTGYVNKVQESIPIVVECLDAVWLLRQKNYKKAWKSTTLKQVLQHITSKANIQLTGTIPQITLKPFNLKDVNGGEALQKLMDEYGLSMHFTPEGQLHVGLVHTSQDTQISYNLRRNVIKSNLKYHKAEDITLKVKAVHIANDNTKTEVEVGDADGATRTFYFYNIESQSELKERAREKLREYKYDGYEGNIETFLIPQAAPGMVASVRDPDFNRDGNYVIEKVRTSFGKNGARRKVTIGLKV